MRLLTTALASCALLCPTWAHCDPVHHALEAYALYQGDVSTLLDQDIDNARSVDAALARIQRDNPANVGRGWIAYGALTAAQSPMFASGVQRAVRGSGRAEVLRGLGGDLTYARRFQHGSGQAIQLILTAAKADAARAADAGALYDHYARTASNVQLVSSTLHPDLAGATRLTGAALARLHIGALAARPLNDATAFGGARFWDWLAGRDARAPLARGGRERQDYASVTDTMLTLGALVAAGAVDRDRDRVSHLLNEPLTQQCMLMQHLQLRQCLSVSVDAGERAYCLGHHGLTGPGGCFSNIAR